MVLSVFQQPAAIGFMVNLSELWADDNAMRQDANTKVLGSLPKLTCLDMSKNHLNSVSDQIGKCTNLMDITLSFNDLQVCIRLILLKYAF